MTQPRVLLGLANKARFLSEVLESNRIPDFNPEPTAKSAIRMDRWLQSAARGDAEAFVRRLAWSRLDETRTRGLLSENPNLDVSNHPPWVTTIESVMRAARIRTMNEPERSISSCATQGQPIAFEEILLPAITVAREELLARLHITTLDFSEPPLSNMSEAAYLRLERSLLERLSYLAARTLGREFSEFRPTGLNLAGILRIEEGKPERNFYNAFTQRLLQDGYEEFFRRYPVLAKLIASAIHAWVETSAQFIERFTSDLPILLRYFSASSEERPAISDVRIESLEPDLSDPHDGGKTVVSFSLNLGFKLVYKPKSLRLEASYYEFLGWCNSNGVPLDFALARVLDRGTYGWMEFIDNTACDDETSVERFYVRAGMLLCILYVMGATDCHYENVVARGEYPVLVDAETLLHPEARPSSGDVERERFDSVLRTGMLPQWECWQKTAVLRDASALGSTDPEGLPSPVWHQVNTDEMYLTWESLPIPSLKHRPLYRGVPVFSDNYVDQLILGFRGMALLLSEARERLLSVNGPLTIFKDLPVRFIFRPTNVYYRVLRSALSPEYLENGIDFGIELEQLAYAFLADVSQPVGWQLLFLEIESLERLDIPYFVASSGSTVFSHPSQTQGEEIFRIGSYEQALERLKRLNTETIDRQVEIIAGAFQAKRIVLHYTSQVDTSIIDKERANETEGAGEGETTEYLERTDFIDIARQLASEIESRAFPAGNNGLNWLGWSYLPDGQHIQLDLLGHSLYDGRLGVALFFAALFATTGFAKYRQTVEETLSIFDELLDTPSSTRTRRWVRNMGIGGVGGFGSVIYLLVKFSQLLAKPSILEQALRSARLVSREDIELDEHFDIINGSAGTLLALLALYDRTGERKILAIAEHCGRVLTSRRIRISKGIGAWQSRSASQPLTGFSHGAAGISYALLRLYEATRGQIYLDVAQEALSYERSTFSALQSNWPDYRTFAWNDGSRSFACSWCHGAPGITLGRLGSLRVSDNAEIRREIDLGLKKSLSALENEQLYVDHICCGNFGLIEVLLVGSPILTRPSLRLNAIRHTTNLCKRARRADSFRLLGQSGASQKFFSPTFFQGMAGIGYTLLRLSCPGVLPTILLLE